MSAKVETTLSLKSIKLLNDECILSASAFKKPLNKSATMGSNKLSSSSSPPKQINLTIANRKSTGATKQKQMEHYTLQIQNIKGEKSSDTGDQEQEIDFIYKENDPDVKNEHNQMNYISDVAAGSIDMDENEEEENNSKLRTGSNTRSEDVEHVCGKCYKSFRRFSGLKKHMDFCRFDSGYHLRKAEMLKNLDKIEKDAIIMENKDICFCCGESYDTFHLGHINCPDCPKSFKTQTSYERHIFITHSEDGNYPCTICNAKLRSENLLRLHVEQHQNRGKPFACKICGKDFTRAYHLKRHQKYSSCMASESDSMRCKVCDKVFFRLDNLRAHLKQHLGSHSAKKPEYMCPICKNCFYSLSTLNIHTRTHTGERPFDCDLCEKKFPSLVALKKHRRYHTGEKPYTCSVCGQSFAVKEVLNRHMKRHTGERPHKCDECGKTFIQASQLRSHAKTHVRPFKCVGCDEKFKTEKQMLRHAKCHNRRRFKSEWKCSTCKQSFENKEDYGEHIQKIHDGIIRKRTPRRKERTDCAICDKNFDTAKSLHFHIRKVHEADPEEIMNPRPLLKGKAAAVSPKVYKLESLSPEKGMQAIHENEEPTVVKNIKLDGNNMRDGGVVVQEFVVDEIDSTQTEAIVLNNNNSYTVIPLENDVMEADNSDQKGTIAVEKKIGIKKSLAESLAAAIADSMESGDEETADLVAALSEEDTKLKNNVGKLLDMLVDSVTLKKFGWPQSTEENVLCQVIENCGHDLSKDEGANYKDCDYATRMREYVKLLFTVVIHNDSIKELLNNYPIDEVIEYVLGNGEDDDDEEDEDNKESA